MNETNQRLINTLLGRLMHASSYNGQPSDQYQLGYFQSLLSNLVEIPQVADYLLDEIARLNTTIHNRFQDELQHVHQTRVQEAQKTVEVSTRRPENRNMIKTTNTQYKKTLRNELAKLGVELDGLYYNDACGNWGNETTSRRIKASISRPLTEVELGTLQGALGNAFDCKIEAKNYDYFGDTVVVYFRK